MLQQVINKRQLYLDEAKGLLRVIVDYTNTWIILQKYDEDRLDIEMAKKSTLYNINKISNI